jgi:hypothetical protein
MAGPKVAAGVRAIIANVIVYAGVITAAAVGLARYRAPQKSIITRIAASVRVKTAITVLAIDVKKAGVSVLQATIDLNAPAAGTYTEGVLKVASVVGLGIPMDPEDEITIDIATLTGTSATDFSFQIDTLPVD